MSQKYLVTGNEYLSIPTLRESDAAVEGITFLHMGGKGMIGLGGDGERPLLAPVLTVAGLAVPLNGLQWTRDHYWIPSFTLAYGSLRMRGTVFCPLGERAFFYRLEVENFGGETVSCSAGLDGCWSETLHEANESKPLSGEKILSDSQWNHSFVIEMRAGFPLFALAPNGEAQMDEHHAQRADGAVVFSLSRSWTLQPGETAAMDYIFGIGFEEVSAATAAKEVWRRGYGALYGEAVAWLTARERKIADPALCQICNTNMFFNFFYASGITLDTEELVLMTSRSPRYYVSCAYWDRDSLLWSFPSILMADPAYAKEILRYVFTRQIRNVGVHSRYIDGTVLEPGFELDELCAPALALERYTVATGDDTLYALPYVRDGIERILKILQSKKHPKEALYESFLQPSDDLCTYPYLTYDNVLVWRMLTDLTARLGSTALAGQADALREAIFRLCVKERGTKRFFCWSTDLNGHFDVYDEPPGSLQLIPYYGLCEADDPVYRNTVEMIRDEEYPYSFANKPIAEIGCAHAPHPWVLAIANSLLSGFAATGRQHLLRTELDNGIACESVDEDTGKCVTGAAFATCAGFLAYAIDRAFGGDAPKA